MPSEYDEDDEFMDDEYDSPWEEDDEQEDEEPKPKKARKRAPSKKTAGATKKAKRSRRKAAARDEQPVPAPQQGYWYGPPPVAGYYPPPPQPQRPRRRSRKPTIAAVLLALMAIIGFGMAGGMVYGVYAMQDLDRGVIPSDLNPEEGDDDANIYGLVMDTGGDPLENVTVVVDGEDIEDLTDENGVFALYNVPYGKQKLILSKEGYRTIEYKLFVEGDIRFDTADDDDDGDYHDGGPGRSGEDEYDLVFRMDEGSGPPVEEGSYPNFVMISNMCMVCAVVTVILSVIMLVAAIYSYRRIRFLFCMVGAIIGIIIALPLGIIAMILLMLSSDDFKENDEAEGAK